MNKIPNRKAICDVLIEKALEDKSILVLCSDSRGSASMTTFFERFPAQTIELGIAEQNLVSVAAGLASCGKKPFVFSPAAFLSARSYEQIKIDCAYSYSNVKLVGISGGISYGALGMSHHSLQDIAAISAIPSMRVYLPSDRHQTKKLIEALLKDNAPAYIRVGRNPVEDIYSENDCHFTLNKAGKLFGSVKNRVLIIACGELCASALSAAKILKKEGIEAALLDMYCVKPLDSETILEYAENSQLVVTAEEHSPYGGLGAAVCQLLAEKLPKRVLNLSMPDEPVINGSSKEVFKHYSLDEQGIARRIVDELGG